MSEPVIKSFMVTMERGEDGKVFLRELYTRDDLVRAVAEAWGVYPVDCPQWTDEFVRFNAEAVVDRLTKGET